MPGVTEVLARASVPDVVIEPPVNPVPAATEVTVPLYRFVKVTFPVLAERLIPAPAIRVRTPAFVTVTLPVFPLTFMPRPAKTPVTAPPPPKEVMAAVTGSTFNPPPISIG